MLEICYSELCILNWESETLCNSGPVLGIDLVEQLNLSLLDVSPHGLHCVDNVLNQVSPVSLAHHLPEQGSRLLEVIVGVGVLVPSDGARHGLGMPLERGVLHWASVGVWLVVGTAALVAVDCHEAISLIIVDSGSVRAVNWNLVKVCTKSVSMGVRVREKSALEHLVIGRFNTRNQISGGKSCLFNLCEVIFRVSVEDKLSNSVQRVI